MPENKPGRWVTVSEAVGILNVSERTIRRYIAINRLPSRKEGKILRVDVSGIEPVIPDPPEPKAEIKRLEAEIKRLEALLDEVKNDRDYLRQINAALISNQQALIEATTTETKPQRSWWPWKKD